MRDDVKFSDQCMSARHRLSIRRATRDDLVAIVRIEHASFGRDAWEREWFADYLAAPENCVFLAATWHEVVVGYGVAVHNQTGSELDSIAVDPAHRGLGIAAAIMMRLNAFLLRRGVSTMTLMVRLDNTAAIGLYRIESWGSNGNAGSTDTTRTGRRRGV
jgi:ribosomal protein S18 acetylase RimI-like enzyme